MQAVEERGLARLLVKRIGVDAPTAAVGVGAYGEPDVRLGRQGEGGDEEQGEGDESIVVHTLYRVLYCKLTEKSVTRQMFLGNLAPLLIYTPLAIAGLYRPGHWQQAFLNGIHDICRRLLLAQLLRHVIHIRRHMVKKATVALAEVIQTGLTVGSRGKTVLGTFAIAKLQPLALLALFRQLLDLHLRKFLLLRTIEHLYERVVVDVTQLVLGKHKVVARIHVAVPFHDGRVATHIRHGADARCGAYPIGECDIEQLYKGLTDIMLHPIVEELAEKLPPLLGRDREVGQLAIVLIVDVG